MVARKRSLPMVFFGLFLWRVHPMFCDNDMERKPRQRNRLVVNQIVFFLNYFLLFCVVAKRKANKKMSRMPEKVTSMKTLSEKNNCTVHGQQPITLHSIAGRFAFVELNGERFDLELSELLNMTMNEDTGHCFVRRDRRALIRINEEFDFDGGREECVTVQYYDFDDQKFCLRKAWTDMVRCVEMKVDLESLALDAKNPHIAKAATLLKSMLEIEAQVAAHQHAPSTPLTMNEQEPL